MNAIFETQGQLRQDFKVPGNILSLMTVVSFTQLQSISVAYTVDQNFKLRGVSLEYLLTMQMSFYCNFC